MRQKICDNHGGDITFSTSLDFSSTHSVCFDANAPRISSLLWYGNGSTNKTLLTNITNNISQTFSRDISNSSELKIDIKFNNIPNDFGTLNSASFSGGSIEAFGYDISDVSDSGNYIASYTDGNYIKMCKVDSSGQTVSNSGKFFVAEDEAGVEYDGHCGTIINTLDKLITLYNAGEINNGSEYVFTPGSTFKAIPPNVFYRARTSVNVSGWPKLSGGQWGDLPGPVLVRDVDQVLVTQLVADLVGAPEVARGLALRALGNQPLDGVPRRVVNALEAWERGAVGDRSEESEARLLGKSVRGVSRAPRW